MRDLRGISKAILPRAIYEPLRRRYIRFRKRSYKKAIETYPRTTVHHAYCGIPLSVLIADPIAKEWYDRDWDELPELMLLGGSKLRQGSRVFNLGAHQGVVASIFARRVGPAGSVIAIEPNPHNVEIFSTNLRINEIDNVKILNAAAGNVLGKVPINHQLNTRLVDAAEDEDVEYIVDMTTVDHLSEKYGAPDILFIDVEGYEAKVLAGAKQTLQMQPDCFVEIHAGGGLEETGSSVGEVLSFFESDRYDTYVRREDDRVFRMLERDDDRLDFRFFLVALARG